MHARNSLLHHRSRVVKLLRKYYVQKDKIRIGKDPFSKDFSFIPDWIYICVTGRLDANEGEKESKNNSEDCDPKFDMELDIIKQDQLSGYKVMICDDLLVASLTYLKLHDDTCKDN